MALSKFLQNRKPAILKRWLDGILETYPDETKTFMNRQADRFMNPVGYTINSEIGNLYQELLDESDTLVERVTPILDRIIRIRAVQDFSPSRAVGPIFLLKAALRGELGDEIRDRVLLDDLTVFETRIDDLALIAFDVYMKHREKLFEIKAGHIRNQVSGLLRRANLLGEVPSWGNVTPADSEK